MKTDRSKMLAVSLFSVCLLITQTVGGQNSERRVTMKDLPEAVQKTVREQSRGSKMRGLSKEVENGNTFYEAELRVSGHNKDVLIDSSGVLVEVEEVVALSSLPAAVRAQIEKQAGKGKILSVESITRNNTVVAYEAHLSRAGKTSEIKVAPDGTPISNGSANGRE